MGPPWPTRGARGEVAFLRGITTQAVAETYIDMMGIEIIAGTGGLLSHAPRRVQSMMILTDAFQPEGVTMMFQDSVFMMPHLGVVSTVHRDAAWQVFDRDCLVRLGSVIAPRGSVESDENVMDVTFEMPNGDTVTESVKGGEVKRITLPERQEAKATIRPRGEFDIGTGHGRELNTTIEGGVVGIILDGRGRPLSLPDDLTLRQGKLREWIRSLEMYPGRVLERG